MTAGRRARVLVAEDDRVARDLLCEILRGEGYEVEAVDDGAGAVERAAGRALRSGRLRRAHGAVGRPRRARPRSPARRRRTPVILITAFGDVTGAMEAIQRGAYDYVSKPFNIEELRADGRRARWSASGWSPSRTRSRPRARPRTCQDIVGKSAGDAGGVQAGGARRGVDGDGAGRRANRAPARSWSRAPSTRTRRARGRAVRAGQLHGAHRVAARSRSCSATRAARSPAPVAPSAACSRWPTAAPCSSTRLATWGRRCRRSCCARCRTARCGRWAAARRSASTCAWSARPTRTSTRRSKAGRFREDLYFRINVVTVQPAAAARAARGRPDPGRALPGQDGAARAARRRRRCRPRR